MQLRKILPGLLLALPISSFAQLGLNLSGFTSDYANANVYGFQTYNVLAAGTSPNNFNGAWMTQAPTISGVQTPYMLVNGGDPKAVVWSESLNVTAPNETFSYYGTSIYSGDSGSTAANMQLYVDGNAVGAVNTLFFNAGKPGAMDLDTIQLGQLSLGAHTFALVDSNGAFSGNDLALAPVATPEPMSFAALGLGIIPVLRRRKRA